MRVKTKYVCKLVVVTTVLLAASGVVSDVGAQAPAATTGAKQPSAYTLQPGDVLTLAVAGLGIERKMSVGLDGRISVPLVGDLQARGKTIDELRDVLRRTMPTKVFQQRLSDGREVGVVIAADEISLVVSDYRPVYVMGDVAQPGEKAYRPGMIVQQVVSMAGGYSLSQMRLENPYMGFADLRSDYDAIWGDVIRYRARITWLRRALEMSPLGADQTSQSNPLTAPLVTQLNQLQDAELAARADRFKRERQALERLADAARDRIKVLERQREREDEGAQFDSAEERRINDLVQRGQAAATRATEARRLGLLSATRALQVEVQTETEKKNLSDTLKQIEIVEGERKVSLSSELQSNTLELAKSLSRRESVWEKMLYAGAARLQLNAGGQNQVKVTINRDGGQERAQLDATIMSDVQPGDVVQVQLMIGQGGSGQ